MATKSIGTGFFEHNAGPVKYIRHSKTEGYVRPDQVSSTARSFKVARTPQASVAAVVIKIMDRDPNDFQTVPWIARQLAMDPSDVRSVLAKMSEVRRPVYGGDKFADWYRLRTRGLTLREKLARLRALITFELMDDDY